MTHSTRGVLGGARTMRRRESRPDRIARQNAERAERQAARAEDETPQRVKKALRVARKTAPAGQWFALPTMNSNRWTAVIIWLVGAYLTRSFLMQVGIAEESATPISLVVQWLLTKGESPLWQGHGRPPLAIICTALDGAMNSAGALVYTKNIGSTDVWTMIQYAAQDPSLAPSIATQVALAIGVGLIVAAAAEYYWNL